MLTRRSFVVSSATMVAAPAIIPVGRSRGRTNHGQDRKRSWRPERRWLYPAALPQRAGRRDGGSYRVSEHHTTHQAIASGDVQIGYGGINASIALAGRGEPLIAAVNATDGGWRLLGGPKVKTFADLKGKKCAVQPASISHLCLQWKLQKENMANSVELLFMNNNDMPIAMQRGDVDALMIFEPYCAFTIVNGWGTPIWEPYDTPMGKTNLGVIASPSFIEKIRCSRRQSLPRTRPRLPICSATTRRRRMPS